MAGRPPEAGRGAMSDAELHCWRCGAVLKVPVLPLRREEVCAGCGADLHVCRQCRFFNPAVSDACDEPLAGGVGNKERANFCGYFTPFSPGPDRTDPAAAARAHEELAALFGTTSDVVEADAQTSRSELERLFGIDGKPG